MYFLCTYIIFERVYPAQIPATPPSILPMIPEKENIPAPQSVGIHPPSVEPIKTPIQINVFGLMYDKYTSYGMNTDVRHLYFS